MRIHNTGYRTYFYPGFLPLPTYVLLLRLRHSVHALPARGPFFAVLLLILLTQIVPDQAGHTGERERGRLWMVTAALHEHRQEAPLPIWRRRLGSGDLIFFLLNIYFLNFYPHCYYFGVECVGVLVVSLIFRRPVGGGFDSHGETVFWIYEDKCARALRLTGGHCLFWRLCL